jgi:hypothetical protein
MIPGKLYCSPVYNTEVWGSVKFEYDEGKHYLSCFLIYMQPETVFMVIENMKDNDNFYGFSKILDTDGNIGYIHNNHFSAIFKEVKE